MASLQTDDHGVAGVSNDLAAGSSPRTALQDVDGGLEKSYFSQELLGLSSDAQVALDKAARTYRRNLVQLSHKLAGERETVLRENVVEATALLTSSKFDLVADTGVIFGIPCGFFLMGIHVPSALDAFGGGPPLTLPAYLMGFGGLALLSICYAANFFRDRPRLVSRFKNRKLKSSLQEPPETE